MIVIYVLGGLLLAVLLYILFLYVCSLFVDTSREYETHSNFYRRLLTDATALALPLLGVRIHVSGLEKIPRDTKKLLFISNHRSKFDPLVTWLVLRRWKPAFISKAENFAVPIFGRFIRKCCFMAIDRENPREALKTIIKASELLKKGEVSVGVYPEGTRSKTTELLPFHCGVFKIAQKAEAPIAVLTVSGTEKIHKNYLRRRTDVYLDVVDILPAETVKAKRTEALGQLIVPMMEAQLAQRENRKAMQNESHSA